MTAPARGGPGRGQAVPSAFRGAALVFVAVVVGIIGLQILDDTGGGSTPSPGPASTTTLPAGERPKPHKATDVTIKVYNASDVQGAAQSLSEKLKGFGYNTLPTANFNTTRKGTVVQCRSGFEGDGVVIAVYGIGAGATSEAFPSDVPKDSEDADCIVISGTL
ncbi:MAG: LytR C-terminal domain-containing protein [Acidimicrobiia bacterium]